jgi:hypothetical protein
VTVPPPVIPAAGLSVGLILLALAFVVCIGLNHVYKLTIGALISTLVSMFDALSFKIPVINKTIGLGFIGDALASVDSWVLAGIGAGIIATEKGMHAVIGWLTWLLQATADEVANLAEDTYRGFNTVKRYLIPALIGAAIAKIHPQLTYVTQKVKNVITHPVQAVHTTVRVIAPGLKALEGKVSALEAKVAAIGAAAPAIVTSPPISITIPRPAAIPGDITKGIDSLWKRVRGIGKTLTPTGIAALVAGATGLLGLSWGRCAKANKLGKNVCGLNDDLLEGLLASTVVVASSISIVEFAKACQAFEPTVEAGLRFFVRELK